MSSVIENCPSGDAPPRMRSPRISSFFMVHAYLMVFSGRSGKGVTRQGVIAMQ
jgi:hypothetical protein